MRNKPLIIAAAAIAVGTAATILLIRKARSLQIHAAAEDPTPEANRYTGSEA